MAAGDRIIEPAHPDLRPGEQRQIVPTEFYCVTCAQPRPRRRCTMCGQLCAPGTGTVASAPSPAVSVSAPARAARAPSSAPPAPLEMPPAGSLPPLVAPHSAGAFPDAPADEDPPTRPERRKPRFPHRTERIETMQTHARHHQQQTDDQGRPVVRMGGNNAGAGRSRLTPEEHLQQLVATGKLEHAAWREFFCAALHGVNTPEDVHEAATLADCAYLEYFERINPA